jgi:SAM-dependent methyltransferase
MLDLSRYRTTGELVIPTADWGMLRASWDPEVLAAALNASAEGLPPPDAEIGEARALNAFQALHQATLQDLLVPGPITLLRCPATTQPEYHTRLRPPGNAASNHFFHTVRLRTPKASAPSTWQKWKDSALRLQVFRRLLKLRKVDYINSATIRLALHMTGATPVQFKPGVAKAVYELTQARDVLDLSMGWGDRLAGFCASSQTRYYTGIDPNPELHSLYQKQIGLYGHGKQFDLRQGAAEDVALPDGRFDLVFTSPPYFGVERYAAGTGNEAGQSWCRYPTAESWRAGFLRPVINRAWRALAPGGIMAINITDVVLDRERHLLCRWLTEIVQAHPDARFHFALGMRLQGANYSDDRRQQVSGEPIWIWSKGDRELPTRLPDCRGSGQPMTRPSRACASPTARTESSPAPRGTPPTPEATSAQIIADYLAGDGSHLVARRYGVSAPTVRSILRRNGHQPRSFTPRRGRSPSNEKPPG